MLKVWHRREHGGRIMSAGVLTEPRSSQSTRRQDILDAAEICFVRNGFHRTTMQDLARQAGMTAGNIYHYFKSKEAVVLGLAERERGHGMTLVEEMERAGDRRGALMGILERYFARATRESAVLRVDLWSEALATPTLPAWSSEARPRPPLVCRDSFVSGNLTGLRCRHSLRQNAEPADEGHSREPGALASLQSSPRRGAFVRPDRGGTGRTAADGGAGG